MALSVQVENAVGDFAGRAGFTDRGGVVIDIDGIAAYEESGLSVLPSHVEAGLKCLSDRGRPVVINSLRCPMSLVRTFGQHWATISDSPVPAIGLNGSQIGYIKRDERGEVGFEEISACVMTSNEINTVLSGVEALQGDRDRELLLFYYPRDWRMGEIIWTPVPGNVEAVKEKYRSASSVSAVELDKLRKHLGSEEICMLFLLVQNLEDTAMVHEHSDPTRFFTAKGADKLTGAKAAADLIGFDLHASLGAGSSPMDVFLNGVGLGVQVGPLDLGFRALDNTIRVTDSFELGDILCRLAGIQELANALVSNEKSIGHAR